MVWHWGAERVAHGRFLPRRFRRTTRPRRSWCIRGSLPACRLYVQRILGLYEHNPFLNRLLIETGRSIVFFNILALHAAYDYLQIRLNAALFHACRGWLAAIR